MPEKSRKRPTYSPEFKAEAVAKCLNIGIYETGRELGVSPSTLRLWILKSEGEPSPSGSKPTYDELEREVQKLRREVGYVNEINRILKKSTAIFSAGEMGGFR